MNAKNKYREVTCFVRYIDDRLERYSGIEQAIPHDGILIIKYEDSLTSTVSIPLVNVRKWYYESVDATTREVIHSLPLSERDVDSKKSA